MSTPAWNVQAFGCISRDGAVIRSLLRTVLTASVPMPIITRKGDTQAPLEFQFTLDLSQAQYRAWEQWTTYDLSDGALPFTIDLPWGTEVTTMRARLAQPWAAQLTVDQRWLVSGSMEIERESLPPYSGGAGPPTDWTAPP